MRQLNLLLRDKQKMVSVEVITAQPDFKSALKLCKGLSGLDDKQLCMALEIDPGQWSRIWSGQANFPENKISKLETICGNIVPTIYKAYEKGYGLIPLKSDTERERDEAIARAEDAEKKLQTIMEYEAAKAGRR